MRSERGSFTRFIALRLLVVAAACRTRARTEPSQWCWIPEWPNEFKLPAHRAGTNEPSNYTRATRSWARPCNAWPDAAGRSPAPVRPDRPGSRGRAPFRFRVHSVFPSRQVRASQTQEPQSQATESNTADSCAAFEPHFLQFSRSRLMMSGAWRLYVCGASVPKSDPRAPYACTSRAPGQGRSRGQLDWSARARLLLASIDRHARARGALRLWLPGVLDT